MPKSSFSSPPAAGDTLDGAGAPVVVALPAEEERGVHGGQLNVRLLDVYHKSIAQRAVREDVSRGEVVAYGWTVLRTLESVATTWSDEQIAAYVRGLQAAAGEGHAVSRWARLWRSRG